MGSGYVISANKDQSFTGADGRGGVTSHKGLRQFQITLNFMDYANGDTSKAVNILEQFYQDTLGGSIPFYFYHPREASSADPTGVSTTGRYLCWFPRGVNPTEWFAPLRWRLTLNFAERH